MLNRIRYTRTYLKLMLCIIYQRIYLIYVGIYLSYVQSVTISDKLLTVSQVLEVSKTDHELEGREPLRMWD
jgi:hypothetical protein